MMLEQMKAAGLEYVGESTRACRGFAEMWSKELSVVG